MISSTESILKITPCYQETIGEVQRKTWGRPGRHVDLQPSWVQPTRVTRDPQRLFSNFFAMNYNNNSQNKLKI